MTERRGSQPFGASQLMEEPGSGPWVGKDKTLVNASEGTEATSQAGVGISTLSLTSWVDSITGESLEGFIQTWQTWQFYQEGQARDAEGDEADQAA